MGCTTSPPMPMYGSMPAGGMSAHFPPPGRRSSPLDSDRYQGGKLNTATSQATAGSNDFPLNNVNVNLFSHLLGEGRGADLFSYRGINCHFLVWWSLECVFDQNGENKFVPFSKSKSREVTKSQDDAFYVKHILN